MIGSLSLAQLAQAIDAELVGDNVSVSGSVSIDTRSLKSGQLFFAIQGEHVDGHIYVDNAFKAGAKACVVEKQINQAAGPLLLVKNTRQSLLQIGRLNRNRFDGVLVGLTGSCGKTSVKEMLAAIFSQVAPTLATRGNFNNDLGMPITLSRITGEHRYAVIEIGTSNPGEIARLTHIAQPHISIITNAEAAHLKGLISVEGVAVEKGAILDSLPAEGVAVLNKDSRFFNEWSQRARARKAEIMTFSLNSPNADVYASDIIHQQDGTTFVLHCMRKSFPIKLAFWGAHQVMNACTATAAALAADVIPGHIVQGLHAAKPYERRGERFIGAKGALIIDESYNANPASTRAAMDMLAACQGTRIFVFGDMGELASEKERAHSEVGVYARQCGIEKLITYGESSQLAASAFGAGAKHFSNKEDLGHFLYTCLSPRTSLLIKGSNGMKMNEIVQRCKSGCEKESSKSESIQKESITSASKGSH